MTEITIWGRFSFIFSAKGKEKTRTAHKNTSRKPISHTLSNSAIYGYLSLLIRTYLLTYVLSLSAVAASISSLFLAKPVLFCMWVKANSGKGREDSLAATGHDCERERENADLEEWQRKGFTAAHSGRAWLVVVVVAAWWSWSMRVWERACFSGGGKGWCVWGQGPREKGRREGGEGGWRGSGAQGSDAWFMNPEVQAFYRLDPVLGVVSLPCVSDMFVASDWSLPPPVTTDNEDVET